jgi:hypothetical protein
MNPQTMKTLTLLLVIILNSLLLNAQFSTPGNGETYNMNDLVAISGGTVTFDGNSYLIHNDITISTSDILEITENITVKVASDKQINIHGTLIVDPPDQVLFTSFSVLNYFQGFRFDNATAASMIRNTTVEYAGGIQLLDTDMLFETCTIRYFDMSATSAAINLHASHPEIRYCLFLENAGSAIGGGANIMNSPQILYNEFIHNGTANTNRPQINLGPAASDTLRIIGNYIEGLYTMAGGIAVANLMSVGHTKALVEDNYVVNNRYGYAGMGSQITSIVRNNHFIDNNIQGQPMLGGSGLNFMGGATNQAFVGSNIIKGNLWGVTIQNNAEPNLGQDGSVLTGYNVIEDNGNSGIIYGLYNNTPGPIFAQNNYWGTDDPDTAASYIVDQNDDPSLGLVTFLPIWVPGNQIEAFVLEAQHNDLEEDVHGTIDHDEQTIMLLLPSGTNLAALIPTITVSAQAVVDPPSGEAVDLSTPVDFTVTAFHGEEKIYTVSADQAFLPPPENLVAMGVPGGGTTFLEWDAPQDAEPLGYNVYRDGVLYNTEQLVYGTEFMDDDFEHGVVYEYYVTAVYVNGESGPSNVVEYTGDMGYKLIYASAGENGSIDPEGVIVLDYGDSQLFVITADEGYVIDSLLVDDNLVAPASGLPQYEYLFENVSEFHDIHVEFTEAGILPGDANCDGQVNVLDVISMVNYFLDLDPESFCFDNADINGDATINILDVILCVEIFAKK